ncbi:hypothetical protein [Streptococcus agalactiae]|uniref:hypothetical protein n=1 Tax=Streptococcus agalactiae TaxID=1311 RepID=UPI0022EA7511|nr:hypothetical protein [Streptococcus agalactiae]
MISKIKEMGKREKKEEIELRSREPRNGDIFERMDIDWIAKCVGDLKRENSIERVKKTLRKIIVEFDEQSEKIDEVFITEIYFWLTLARQFRSNEVISDIVKVRFRDLELLYNLSEEEELLKHWIAEIFYDLGIIDFIESKMSAMWLLKSKTSKIMLTK